MTYAYLAKWTVWLQKRQETLHCNVVDYLNTGPKPMCDVLSTDATVADTEP